MFTALRLLLIGLAALLGCAALPAMACTVTPSATVTKGPYSPQALKTANAVPQTQSRAGISCPNSLIVLLGNNYIKGTFTSANNLKISDGATPTANTLAYVASLDAAGTYKFTQGGTTDFLQNNLLNVLGLLGGSNVDIPLYVKFATAPGLLPVGTYSDRITIDWSWRICDILGIGNACVGTLITNTGQSVININVTVAAQSVTTTITRSTTWDAANGTYNPKAIPGSKQRVSVAIANPDLVPLDSGTVNIVVPTPAGAAVALDGDGASLGAAIRGTEGSPASSLALTYTAPNITTDDVDFSSDNGATWTYYPTAGDIASENAVTHVRLRPRGGMAKQSAYSISIPYRVK